MEKITVKATLFRVDNAKGFKYDKEIITEALNKYVENCDGSGIIYGQINPSDYSLHTPISKASHKIDINSFNVTDEGVYCDIEPLNTPDGKMLQEVLDEGINPKFAIRAIGDAENLNIISIDVV